MISLETECSPLWQELGWRIIAEDEVVTTYEGDFSIKGSREEVREFVGQVEIYKSSATEMFGETVVRDNSYRNSVFILNPPPEIRGHSKGSCFQYIRELERGDRIFKLHFIKAPEDVDTAILYTNGILTEIINPSVQ